MKIAILTCRDFKIPGGAERLEIDMAIALDATIVCLSVDPEFREMYPLAREVTFHPLHRVLPGEPFKQLLGMHLFRHLTLPYDFFIVMDDMALRYLVNQVPHMYYMHTPRRIFYDMYYPAIREYPIGERMFMRVVLSFFRYLDQRFVAKHVKNIACNSHNTRNRIWKAYQREATVLYPPVHTELYENKGYTDYWLAVTRVDKWKRIELLIETFRLLPDIPLIIAGKIYPQYRELVIHAPDNVTFLDSVNDKDLISLYSLCRGFVTTAIDEDFGITPVEAMASGKPVVAVREGGYQETVVDGRTGILVAPDKDELAGAISDIDRDPSQYAREARKRAEQFRHEIFKEAVTRFVNTCTNSGEDNRDEYLA